MANLSALDGSTFVVSDESGDFEAERAEGFFHEDMRHLSCWRLLVDSEPPRTLSSGNVDYYSARVVGSAADDANGAPTIAVRRERFVSGGLHEDLFVENLTDEPSHAELVLEFASDFATADASAAARRSPSSWHRARHGRRASTSYRSSTATSAARATAAATSARRGRTCRSRWTSGWRAHRAWRRIGTGCVIPTSAASSTLRRCGSGRSRT